jgi:surfactin synthase thioesterase subunit
MDGLNRTARARTDGAQVRWRPLDQPRLRLFCLPHAGGGAVAYRRFPDRAPADVEVVAIRLPGRESRFREPPLTRLDDVVDSVLHAVGAQLNRPHAWFGHSMGALIAYEVCRAIRRRGLPAPRRLLVSGRPAPHLPLRDPPVHAAPTPQFVTHLRGLGGTAAELLDDPAAQRALLPTLRADFRLAETYRHQAGPPLDCPISVFGGSQDRLTTAAELDAWRQHTAAGCTVRICPGGHFFLHENDEFPALLGADLAATQAAPDRTPHGDASDTASSGRHL